MANKTLLCTCVSCLKENPNGIQLNLNTYNRHRKRQQELSKKDEILEVIEQKGNVKVFESQVEDVLYQEEFQTENILNQEEFQIANILHQKEFQTEDINKVIKMIALMKMINFMKILTLVKKIMNITLIIILKKKMIMIKRI